MKLRLIRAGVAVGFAASVLGAFAFGWSRPSAISLRIVRFGTNENGDSTYVAVKLTNGTDRQVSFTQDSKAFVESFTGTVALRDYYATTGPPSAMGPGATILFRYYPLGSWESEVVAKVYDSSVFTRLSVRFPWLYRFVPNSSRLPTEHVLRLSDAI